MGFTVAGVSALTAASLAAAAGSAAVGAVGAISSSQAQASNARYQAQVARNNAVTASNNADLAQQQGAAKAQSDNRATAIKLGAQRAALGADGGTLDSGSGLGIQRDTANQGALAASQEMYQANLAAYGYRSQATNFTAQSDLDSNAAANSNAAGGIGAASSIISGASQFASKWNSYANTSPGTIGSAGYTGPDGNGGQWV